MFEDLIDKKEKDNTPEDNSIYSIPTACVFCASENTEIATLTFDDQSQLLGKVCFSCNRVEVLSIIK